MPLFRYGTSPNVSFSNAASVSLSAVSPAESNSPPGGSTDSRLRSFGTPLSRSIHTTEKAAEVSRQCDNDYGHSLDRQAVSGQDLFLFPPGSHVDEPHHKIGIAHV